MGGRLGLMDIWRVVMVLICVVGRLVGQLEPLPGSARLVAQAV
jgi:hypothetical protein